VAVTSPRVLKIGLPLGIGGILYLKAHLDQVKDEFEEIEIGFGRGLIPMRSEEHEAFWLELARLLFQETPYTVKPEFRCGMTTARHIIQGHGAKPCRPRLAGILCDGVPYWGKHPYVVVHTKVRGLLRDEYKSKREEWLAAVAELSRYYEVVILGEREVEETREYCDLGPGSVYCIYEDLRGATFRSVDLTFPAFGLCAPDLHKLRQDCVLIRDSTASVHMGLGGPWCIATSVGDVVSYHGSREFYLQRIFAGDPFERTVVTGDWDRFLEALEQLVEQGRQRDEVQR